MGGVRFVLILFMFGAGSLFQAGTAQAQARSSSDSSGMVRNMMLTPGGGIDFPASMTPYVRFGMSANDTNSQRSTLEALVGSSVEPLKWPDLPRVWWRFEGYKGQTQTSYYGFQWSQNKISGSSKNAFIYKYNRSISFVLIGSLRSTKSYGAPGTTVDGQVAMQHLVIEDDSSGMLYPNVREDYPMVGLCMYDLSVATERTHSLSFDILGNGSNSESVQGFGTPFTLYSNFFQLDGNKPIISHYVLERCQKMFETAMKTWVEEQFSKAHRAYRTEMLSSCKRERGGTDRTAVGDRGCFAWHLDLPEPVQRLTIPRCERGTDDLFHCVTKSKAEGSVCPMMQGNDARIVPAPFIGGLSPPSTPCDEDQGLVCVPSLPKANITNLETNRLFLSTNQLNRLGICKKRDPAYSRRR